MAIELWANNAESTIDNSGGITSTGTTITLPSGEGARFPAAVTGTSQFRAVLVDGATIVEYITVTNRSADTLTVVRESEDATRFPKAARAQGVKVVDVVTAAVLSLIGVPAGGAQGAALVKSSSTDYAVAWQAAPISECLVQGIKSWNYDLALATANQSTDGSGWVDMVSVPLVIPTVSTVHFYVSSAGSGLTAGRNFVGLYSEAGSLLGSASTDSVFTSTGFKSVSISATPTGSTVYVAFLSNGTTDPKLAGLPTSTVNGANGNRTSPTLRFASLSPGGKITLPASFSSQSALAASQMFWAGIS